MSRKARLSSRIRFTDWESVLSQSNVPPRRQESTAITIRWYLSWAKRARVAVDFDPARDFITQVELEEWPVPYRLEQWKEALRWFFREGKRRQENAAGVESSTSNEGATDNGRTSSSVSWRDRMIRLFRVRKYSYRTEQSYVGWLTRFERFMRGRAAIWVKYLTCRQSIIDLLIGQVNLEMWSR